MLRGVGRLGGGLRDRHRGEHSATREGERGRERAVVKVNQERGRAAVIIKKFG